jgi:capsular exopolysaccharide synthesis family protein
MLQSMRRNEPLSEAAVVGIPRYQPEPAAEGSKLVLAEILWRRRKTLLLTLIACLIGAVAFLATATRRYTSTAAISVQQDGVPLIGTAGVVAQTDAYLYKQAELLRASPVISAACASPGMKDLKAFRDVDDVIEHLKKNLGVDVGKKDEIISVSYEAADPAEATKLVNAVVAAYVDYESRQRGDKSSEALRVLQAEKGRLEAEIARQNGGIVAFKQANSTAFFETQQGNVILQNLAVASEHLTKARLMTKSAEATFRTSMTKNVLTLRQAQQTEIEFQKVVDDLQAKASLINEARSKYDLLQQDLTRTIKALDTIDQRVKELSVTEDAGPLNITVLEPARAGRKATYPAKPLVLALALACGLVLGVSAALAHDWIDQRIRTAEEVEDLLGVTVMGVIPTIREVVSPDGSARLMDPSSDVAEAYRSLRRSLSFELSGSKVKSVLVTSPAAGDGKSTTARNLAVAHANAGRRTLLIDADFSRPVQRKAFGLPDGPGLFEVLTEGVPTERAVVATRVPGLDLLAASFLPRNSSEQLETPAFVTLLEGFCDAYDQVIIDAAPVLPASDPRILASLCDVSVLVLRAERSTRRGSEQACDLLFKVGAKAVGAVVNDVDPRSRGYADERHVEGYRNGNGHGNGHVTRAFTRPAAPMAAPSANLGMRLGRTDISADLPPARVSLIDQAAE